MKLHAKFILTVLLIILLNSITAQIVNINPDTTDVPWIAGDAYVTPGTIEALR